MLNTTLEVARCALLLAAVTATVACAGEVDDGDDSGKGQSGIAAEDCVADAIRACEQTQDTSRPGYQFCYVADGGNVWSECAPDYRPSGPDECSADSEWNGHCCVNFYSCCEGEPCNTPLVMSFDGAPVRYDTAMSGSFDLTGRGVTVAMDWPTAATPWLALDRNGDGVIGDGGELFGSATRLSGGGMAAHGFAALAELDDDHDGFITAADSAFSRLVLWSDRDADRSSSASELRSLAGAGLEAIELAYGVARRCDARGNCEVERARFWFRDELGAVRVGEVVDVHLELQ